MSIYVLRLGHRPSRDKRITSHLMLTARAFGASGVIYTGTRDPKVEETVRKACSDWGGPFSVEYAEDWRGAIKRWKTKGKVVHLTMYGLPIRGVINSIRDAPSEKLVVVGGAKVPGELFGIADWNVAVTSQPHSEVSALAVFLHELFEGGKLARVFEDARLRVIPQARGRRVEETSGAV